MTLIGFPNHWSGRLVLIVELLKIEPVKPYSLDSETLLSRCCKQTLNWRKGYEELFEACDRLKLAIQDPQFFCETWFANSVRKVYRNFLADLSAAIACLENTKFEMHDGDASEREKAQQAEQYQVKIQNKSFCLLLSGLADIYEQYGVLVSEVQKVNLLPFQRFDKFTGHMEKQWRI